MMRAGRNLASAILIATAVLRPDMAAAHHAFAAEFDSNAPVLLRGTIVKVEWVNPHAWVHIKVTEDGDEPVIWMIEGGTPNTLLRAGVTRHTLKPGTAVIVRGYQSKDRICVPACKANGRDITFENGEKVFMGSSGTGAPRDGTDPREGDDGTSTLPSVKQDQ